MKLEGYLRDVEGFVNKKLDKYLSSVFTFTMSSVIGKVVYESMFNNDNYDSCEKISLIVGIPILGVSAIGILSSSYHMIQVGRGKKGLESMF